jgi:hypothetical protein
MTKFTKDTAKEMGKRGGQKTLREYGRKQLMEWGKLGGNPKLKGVDKSLLTPNQAGSRMEEKVETLQTNKIKG